MSFLLKDQAYEKLIQLINEGKLKYGETYSLNALAQDLEMSRTPVRDAIQKLADEKRIDVLPSRGIRLHQMTVEEITQHYHFSTAIEGYCASCLAKACKENPENPYVRKLEENLTATWDAVDSHGDFGEFFALDQQFHRVLLDSLQDPYFSALQDSPMGFFNHPELQQVSSKISRRDICQCHQQILDAVKVGDPVQAYRAVMTYAALMHQVGP